MCDWLSLFFRLSVYVFFCRTFTPIELTANLQSVSVIESVDNHENPVRPAMKLHLPVNTGVQLWFVSNHLDKKS